MTVTARQFAKSGAGTLSPRRRGANGRRSACSCDPVSFGPVTPAVGRRAQGRVARDPDRSRRRRRRAARIHGMPSVPPPRPPPRITSRLGRGCTSIGRPSENGAAGSGGASARHLRLSRPAPEGGCVAVGPVGKHGRRDEPRRGSGLRRKRHCACAVAGSGRMPCQASIEPVGAMLFRRLTDDPVQRSELGAGIRAGRLGDARGSSTQGSPGVLLGKTPDTASPNLSRG